MKEKECILKLLTQKLEIFDEEILESLNERDWTRKIAL